MAKRIGDQNCWIRIFEVAEPTRHRKGFTVYKVISTVFPKSFPESATKIVVWKRYSDFRKLHKELEQIFKQLFLKGEFPLFPKAKVFGRFEHEVVEERRLAALTLLEFTANHTQLFTSKAFIHFFENGYSTQDFIGQILFSNKGKGGPGDPPTTVFAETSELNAPCLEPQKVWSTKTSLKDEDCLSISASSISSSLSPDAPEAPDTTNGCDCNPMPTLSTSSNNNLVKDQPNVPGTENKSVVPSTPESRNKIPVQNHTSIPVPLIEQSQARRQDGSSDTSESTVNPSSRNSGIVRSATVTDDLSSYFDEDFEDAAFLYPTGSCSSLDTLPGYTPMVDTPESSQKASSHSSRGIFSLSRRKPNGFGLFDFLPLFPKKSKKKLAKEDPKQISQDKSDSLVSAGYICEAAGHFAVAQFHESNSEFQDAFRAYKEGIRVLLAGAQDDTDRDRKLLAKNKLEKYLSRAESLKENCLLPGNSGVVGGAISPVFSSPNKQAKCLSSLNQSGKGLHPYGDTMLSNLEELKLYKVVGLGSGKNKILVVMNPSEPTPKCYAAKVLWKSPCVVYPDKPNIIPGRVPFMVKLEKWFDTADKIVLLLEHAGGGRLVDFVTNYQSKRISFVSPPDLDTPTENNPTSGLDGILHEMLKDSNDTTGDTKPFNEASLDCAVSQLVRKNNTLPGILDERPEIAAATDSVPEPEVAVSDIGASFLTPPENSADQTKVVPETSDPTLDMDVSKLLENSKALLQTVSKTLEEGKISKKVEVSKTELTPICDVNPKDGSDLQDKSKKEDISEVNHEALALTSNQAVATSPTDEDIQETKEEEGSNTPKRMVPEGCVKVWAAEIIMALEALHDAGITYGDLNINDILLGENGHVLLAYKSLLKDIDDPVTCNYYMAPEVRDSIGVPLWKIHPSADWWSVGAILFLIITGQSFDSAHPEGVFSEMIIKVPETSVTGSQISKAAKTLLVELLHHSPELRLGYYGAAEIKTHPFFEGFDWNMTEEECTAQV